jgi:hypothetical protein
MSLLHGFLLQRVAFDLTDTAGFTGDIRMLLEGWTGLAGDGRPRRG